MIEKRRGGGATGTCDAVKRRQEERETKGGWTRVRGCRWSGAPLTVWLSVLVVRFLFGHATIGHWMWQAARAVQARPAR